MVRRESGGAGRYISNVACHERERESKAITGRSVFQWRSNRPHMRYYNTSWFQHATSSSITGHRRRRRRVPRLRFVINYSLNHALICSRPSGHRRTGHGRNNHNLLMRAIVRWTISSWTRRETISHKHGFKSRAASRALFIMHFLAHSSKIRGYGLNSYN